MGIVMLLRSSITVFLIVCWIASASDAKEASWNEWLEWQPCSVSCGVGIQKRLRTCSPPSKPGGKWCEGQYVESKECDTGLKCPVNGNWSAWSLWTECSVSCGQGTMSRYRSCSNPFPEAGGRKCIGKPRQSQSCNAVKECPRDGGWSSWSQWSKCSVTCGTGGTVHRYRSCNNPPPAGEGRPCSGTGHDPKPCQAPIPCPVNGQWSAWTDWTECSVTCGSGSRSRKRACDNPPPLHGGDDCDRKDASEVQIASCMAEPSHCPVNGGWSPWGGWRECQTPDCGSPGTASRSFRHRSCTSPKPAHNGAMCEGPFLHAGLCSHPLNCKVDGGWSDWSAWNCTGSRDVAFRLRTCDKPVPANGGKKCKGTDKMFLTKDDEDERVAYFKACPGDPSDDEDIGEGSGNREASGLGSSFDDEEDD